MLIYVVSVGSMPRVSASHLTQRYINELHTCNGNFPLGFKIQFDFSDNLEGVLETRFFEQKNGSQDTFSN